MDIIPVSGLSTQEKELRVGKECPLNRVKALSASTYTMILSGDCHVKLPHWQLFYCWGKRSFSQASSVKLSGLVWDRAAWVKPY